jgi:hypothetical protein
MDEGDMAQEGYGSEFYGTVMLLLLTATAIPIVVAVVYKTPVERALQFLQGVAKDLPETEAAAEADAVADAERVSEPEPAQEQESEPEPEPEPELVVIPWWYDPNNRVHGLSAATRAEKWAGLGLGLHAGYGGMASPQPFRPLAFTLKGDEIELTDNGALATARGGSYQSVVCGDAPMATGRHFVELTVVAGGGFYRGSWMAGVIGEGFDPAGGGTAHEHVQGWLGGSSYGSLRTGAEGGGGDWEGQCTFEDGDCVGLLLDLGAGSLAVYLNGERLGLMVREGIAPPVRWVVDLLHGASARLESQPAPRPRYLYQ